MPTPTKSFRVTTHWEDHPEVSVHFYASFVGPWKFSLQNPDGTELLPPTALPRESRAASGQGIDHIYAKVVVHNYMPGKLVGAEHNFQDCATRQQWKSKWRSHVIITS